jgi:ech hydrogenase subunit D
MSAQATIESIEPTVLLDRVRALKDQGYRLVQLSASRLAETIELTYSFDLNNELVNLRYEIPASEPTIFSICSIFPAVVLYENEFHDLFGVKVEGMALDFHGGLYQTAMKYPLGSPKVVCAKPAPAPAVKS